MKKIKIAEGIYLTASDKTIEAFLEERKEMKRLNELTDWLKTHTEADQDYSDIFKEVYGVRPKG